MNFAPLRAVDAGRAWVTDASRFLERLASCILISQTQPMSGWRNEIYALDMTVSAG